MGLNDVFIYLLPNARPYGANNKPVSYFCRCIVPTERKTDAIFIGICIIEQWPVLHRGHAKHRYNCSSVSLKQTPVFCPVGTSRG